MQWLRSDKGHGTLKKSLLHLVLESKLSINRLLIKLLYDLSGFLQLILPLETQKKSDE